MDRNKILELVIVGCFLGILSRLFYWQIVKGPLLQQMAQGQYEHTSVLGVARGRIFSADGYPLVLNSLVYTLYATPKVFQDTPLRIASLLGGVLPASQSSENKNSILEKLGSGKNWIPLARNLDDSTKSQIQALGITGIGFDPLSIRYYPEASMAAHVLGFVGSNAQGNPQGYFGLEGKYDLELRGKSGQENVETDALGNPILLDTNNTIQSITGRDIYTTIVRDIQDVVEQKLSDGMAKYGAIEADAIVMEPSTGKILAMASLPNYDPRSFSTQDPALFKNPMVADGYEPGSTFKVVTVAAGIDTGVINPDTPCADCGAPKVIGKYTIRTWNDKYQKDISMTDALVHSDNTAMMFVADKLGKSNFLKYVQKFGFGSKTGIDLQEEASPPLRDINTWGDIDVATGSFGQGIAVTGIQILDAIDAVANKGIMMRPMVVSKVVSDQGTFPITPQVRAVVISPKTAQLVTQMMIQAATRGDAKWALPKGYLIAGKTGTAQIPINGHYDPTRTIASFVGFAPADNPKFAMLVRLVDPQTSQWGSETAAPLWFDISKELFFRMGIQPTL